MQVTDCPDEATCPGGPHEWTPEPRVIHKPRRCLRGARTEREAEAASLRADWYAMREAMRVQFERAEVAEAEVRTMRDQLETALRMHNVQHDRANRLAAQVASVERLAEEWEAPLCGDDWYAGRIRDALVRDPRCCCDLMESRLVACPVHPGEWKP